MSFSNEGLVVVLLVGLLAGWTVGNIGRGSGLGLSCDLIAGGVGAFIGHRTLPPVHVYLGHGLVSLVITSMIGAIVLLLVIRVLQLMRPRVGGAGCEPVRGFESRWKMVELKEAGTIGQYRSARRARSREASLVNKFHERRSFL
jgi:uncharacterized membrane protein YeaQ/YmgE (transglycosylase-associated protein family)